MIEGWSGGERCEKLECGVGAEKVQEAPDSAPEARSRLLILGCEFVMQDLNRLNRNRKRAVTLK